MSAAGTPTTPGEPTGAPTGAPTTTMWEVRAAEGRLADLTAWLRGVLPGDARTEVYSSPDERLVVIATGRDAPPVLPDPPAAMVRRPAHQWVFHRLPR